MGKYPTLRRRIKSTDVSQSYFGRGSGTQNYHNAMAYYGLSLREQIHISYGQISNITPDAAVSNLYRCFTKLFWPGFSDTQNYHNAMAKYGLFLRE